MKIAMKTKLILFAAFAGALAVSPAGAQGQKAPYDAWCRDMQLGRGGGTTMVCRAYTYQQCMASRTSHIENCYLNPLYDPRFAEWRRRNPQY